MSVQRPALDELLGLLRKGDTVLVARFFRLGRSRDHVIHLVNSFHQRGIHFKALDLGIDTTPAGKFMLSIFASLAEYDRESILEKTRAGQQLADAQGKHIGRPKGLNAENPEPGQSQESAGQRPVRHQNRGADRYQPLQCQTLL